MAAMMACRQTSSRWSLIRPLSSRKATMADDAPSELLSRRHQMFPVLTDAEIARIRRFGTPRHYARGERLFTVGERGRGMFVVLEGSVSITQRDGLGTVVPIVRQGPGNFL